MFIHAALFELFGPLTKPKVEITDEYEPMEEGLDKVQMGHGMALSRKTDGFLWIIVGKIHIYL